MNVRVLLPCQLLTPKMHFSLEDNITLLFFILSTFVILPLSLSQKKNQAIDLKNNSKRIRNKRSCRVKVMVVPLEKNLPSTSHPTYSQELSIHCYQERET